MGVLGLQRTPIDKGKEDSFSPQCVPIPSVMVEGGSVTDGEKEERRGDGGNTN